MRILHLNQYGTYAGGTEAYILEVSRALAAMGHEARLVSFAPERSADLMPGTISISSTDRTDTITGIERVIAKFRPDLAFIHAVYDPLVLRYISGRLPAIAYVHGPYIVCPGNALFLRRSAQVCRRHASLNCLINAQTEHCCFGRSPVRHLQRLRRMQALLKATSQINVLVGSEYMRSRLIANGLQPKRVEALAPLLFTETPPEFIPPSDPKAILFAGRITFEKGLRHLIEALAAVRDNWRLIVAGDGPDRAACERLAGQLGVAQRIEFAGWVTPETMQMLYRHCALAAVPSLWPEPYGRIGPEAFLLGRPVVAFAVGGIPEWLEDGETGYLATPGSIASLGAGISRLIRNPHESEGMGRQAQERAKLHWNAQMQMQKLMASFDDAIGRFANGS